MHVYYRRLPNVVVYSNKVTSRVVLWLASGISEYTKCHWNYVETVNYVSETQSQRRAFEKTVIVTLLLHLLTCSERKQKSWKSSDGK